jgi:hypothetical protein
MRSRINKLDEIYKKLDFLQQAIARIENRQLQEVKSMNIQDYEFKAYSQSGEDGIIQFLLRNIEIQNKIFVEFGVENYKESNTRFLLQNNYWSGLIIDGSSDNIQHIKNDSIYWKYNLKAEYAFIDRDNINDIIKSNGIYGDIGVLSIDIDGNDYWIWESINCIMPRIVICEYNSLFGPSRRVTIPYSKNFIRSKAHFSNVYYGASISALDFLSRKKGYSLVGSNRAGNNIFFVRTDLVGDIRIYNPEEVFVKAQFRETRDRHGKLTFLDFYESMKLIREMPLYDIDLNTIIKVKDILPL